VYTLFVRSGEKGSSLAQELTPVIKNVHKFCDFYRALMLQSLRKWNFFELADNGLLGCSGVVGANARKWGHLGVICARLCAPDEIVELVQKTLQTKLYITPLIVYIFDVI